MAKKYDADYQKQIDVAVANGDFQTAAWNEKMQNQKIDDLGLDYEKTYNYVQYDDSDSAITQGADLVKTVNASNGSVDPLMTDNTDDFYFYGGRKPKRDTQYADQQTEYLNKYLNQEDFSYDPKDDPLYQSYQEQYTRNGQMAMQDTLGQVAARTGGMASSYAGTAAQQTYDGYMRELGDIIPQLRQAAYEMYQDKGDRYLNAFSMLGTQQDRSDGWYRDSLSQYNNDRQFGYDVWNNDRAFDYQVDQDTKYWEENEDQKQYDRGQDERQWNYQLERDAVADAQYHNGGSKAYSGLSAQAQMLLNLWQQDSNMPLEGNLKEALNSGLITQQDYIAAMQIAGALGYNETPKKNPQENPESNVLTYIRSLGGSYTERQLKRMLDTGKIRIFRTDGKGNPVEYEWIASDPARKNIEMTQ